MRGCGAYVRVLPVVQGCCGELQSRHKWSYHGDGCVMNGEDDIAELCGGCCRLANSDGAVMMATFSGMVTTRWLRFRRPVVVVGRCGDGWR